MITPQDEHDLGATGKRRYYWRVANIPELDGMSQKARSKVWSEALSRSYGAGNLIGYFAVMAVFAVLVAFFSANIAVLSSGRPHFEFVMGAITLMNMAHQLFVVQPRARRWLRANPEFLQRWS